MSSQQGMADSFFDALGLDRERFHAFRYRFDQIAELLPEPRAWMVNGRGDDGATLLLLAESRRMRGPDALFTVASGAPHDDLIVTFHEVEIAAVTYRRMGMKTTWRFELKDRDPLDVEGRLGDPGSPGDDGPPDQAEAFARALAESAGWSTRGTSA